MPRRIPPLTPVASRCRSPRPRRAAPTSRALRMVLAVFAFLTFAPAAAHGSATIVATPVFPTTVTVGNHDVAAHVLLTNVNAAPDGSLTVCNVGDGGRCTKTEGITLLASCGSYDISSVCGGFDPRVFSVDSTAVGAPETACAGMAFSATVVDEQSGKVTFRPSAGNVVLPTRGSVCRIDFTVDVLAFPKLDAEPVAAGLQTVQVAEANGWSDLGGFTSNRGTSNGTTVRGAPAVASNASPAIVIGRSVTDTATLTGAYNPTAGDVTFALYGPDDETCARPAAFSSTVTVGSDGIATSPPHTPSIAGTYRWVASYGGDAYNDPASGTCDQAGATARVAKASPSLQTNASPPVVVGDSIADTAELTAEHSPAAGDVTFRAYGPADATCSGSAAFTSTVPIAGGGTASSAAFTPAVAGVYRWVASYAGDANNDAANGACNDPGETVTVAKASPAIRSVASPAIVIGGTVGDTAVLTNEAKPAGGHVTFSLYGPGDAACSGPPAFTTIAAVGDDGTASSTAFTATAPGTYRWIAEYGGDPNNDAATGACNDPNATVQVSQSSPTLQTDASAAIVVGGALTGKATLMGEFNPTAGSTTFKLYGPDDAACTAAAAFTSTVAMASTGTAVSGAFEPPTAGTYRWIASYGGDANNPAAPGACNDAGSSVVVRKSSPSIHADASPAVALGAAVTSGATLTGEHNPTTNDVTFALYGPGDTTCAGTRVFTSAVTVGAAATATSAEFTPTAPGTYRWTVRYAGDANNDPAGGTCGDSRATVTVSKLSPAIDSNASPAAIIGATITASAAITGERNPTAGGLTFRAFGPSDENCGGTPAFESAVPIGADGTATSAGFTPTTAGTYRWVTSYDGDANNSASAGACNGAHANVSVGKASPTMHTRSSPSVAIRGAVFDTAVLAGASTPAGGTVTFRLYGPGDATCATAPAFASTVAIAAAATATSASFTPAVSGTYRWTADYSGDVNNDAASGACNDADEAVTAGKASPTITTKPSAGVTLGESITDTATLADEASPTAGNVTFVLYGPQDATCSQAAVFTSAVAISADGNATAAPFTPADAGTYRWIARYSGDANNGAAISGCDDTNAAEVEIKASPLLCGNTQIALVDVFSEGSRMIISGVARPSLRGKRATIVLASTGATVAAAKISKTGSFAATAPLPPKRIRRSARYAAVLKPHRSAALKLERRSYLTKAVVRGERLVLAGKVTGKFKKGAKVSIMQITLCTNSKPIATTKLTSKGTWQKTIDAPDDATSVLYRAKTTVLNDPRTELTFTLPRPATLSSAP
jgi:hypothetical protein